MSWSAGNILFVKGLEILEEFFPDKTECAIYISGFIYALGDEDWDYMQFRESGTDKLLDYVDRRNEIYDSALSKLEKSVRNKFDYPVVSHYSTVAHRNIKQAELKKLKSSTALRAEAFQAILDISTDHIDDEDSLEYYTQSLINCFPFIVDDLDELVASNKKLAPIVEQIKKEEEERNVELQKLLKKKKNLPELDEIFKKFEAEVKRSLTALSKTIQGDASEKPKTREPKAPQPTSDQRQSIDEKPEVYRGRGFSESLNIENRRHIRLISEKTGYVELDIENVLRAYEECLLADLEKKNKTNLLTIIRLRAYLKEVKPERMGINPFTGEEMLFKARPGGLEVKAAQTRRLKDFLTNIYGKSKEQSDTKVAKPSVIKEKAEAAGQKKSKVVGKKKKTVAKKKSKAVAEKKKTTAKKK